MIRELEQLTSPTCKEAFVFIGPPTSGKSSHTITFAEILDARLVRGRDIVPDMVSQYEGDRQLIPDEVYLPALSRILEGIGQSEERIIFFDNIPRTRAQAQLLSEWGNRTSVKLHTLVLVLSKEEVLYRFQKRLTCPKCGSSYHPILKPSRVEGRCDRDLTDLKPRIGDRGESIESAYQHYETVVQEVIPDLQMIGEVHRISALGTVPEIANIIASRFNFEAWTNRFSRGV